MLAYRRKTQNYVKSEVIDYNCAQSESFKNTQITIKETQTKGEVFVKLNGSTLLLSPPSGVSSLARLAAAIAATAAAAFAIAPIPVVRTLLGAEVALWFAACV